MFRQVVVCRWSKDVSDEGKQAFRDAMESLRDIPELLAMKFGDDAGHFEGNFDFAAVMDFAIVRYFNSCSISSPAAACGT